MDVPGGNTCYELYSYKDEDNAAAVPLERVSSDSLKDGAWSLVFRGEPDESALTNQGDYLFFLDVKLVEGDCETPQPHTIPAVNSFIVRATADLWVWDNDGQVELSVMGWDSAGPFTPETPSTVGSRDSAYNGRFDYLVEVPPTSKEVLLRDADGDDLEDALDPAGLYGGEDVQSSGVAIGANTESRYDVYDDAGTLIYGAENVSGNHDASGTLRDVEGRKLSPQSLGAKPGWWTWSWTNVLAENNIRLGVPESNGQSPGWPLRMSSKRLRPLRGSTAREVTYWQGAAAAITPLLPITLGSGASAVTVWDAATALAILEQAEPSLGGESDSKVAVCHVPPGNSSQAKLLAIGRPALAAHLEHGDTVEPARALAKLSSELLAAKLNVAHQVSGEHMTAMRIQGTGTSVGDAIAAADALLSRSGELCKGPLVSGTSGLREELAEATLLLEMVNAAQVTLSWKRRTEGTAGVAAAKTASSKAAASSQPEY